MSMSSFEEHEAEQARITAECEAGECDHPECHEDEPARRVVCKCPKCGSPSMYLTDVSAFWCEDLQAWALSDESPKPLTEAFCGDCGAESYVRDVLIPAGA